MTDPARLRKKSLLGHFSRIAAKLLPVPAQASQPACPRILMYHMVAPHLPKGKFNKLRVTPNDFERQLEWLTSSGWTILPLSRILEASRSGDPLPHKSVAITFDDGFRDNFTNAFPILRKFNAPATIFLVVDRHDRDWTKSKKPGRATTELLDEPKLHDSEVQAMLASGLVELGGHTLTHPYLPDITSSATRWSEIASCRDVLSQTFATSVASFAYPFGHFTPADAAAAREAGYLGAVTTENAIAAFPFADPFTIPRIKVGGKKSHRDFRKSLLQPAISPSSAT